MWRKEQIKKDKNKETFFKHQVCLGEKHCQKCRDKINGKKFRQDWVGEDEFQCRIDKPWGFIGIPNIKHTQLTLNNLPIPESKEVLPMPIDYSEWPLIIKGFAGLFRKDGEEGIGDTIKHQLMFGNKEAIKSIVVFLKGYCTCERDRKRLNAKYPYANISKN